MRFNFLQKGMVIGIVSRIPGIWLFCPSLGQVCLSLDSTKSQPWVSGLVCLPAAGAWPMEHTTFFYSRPLWWAGSPRHGLGRYFSEQRGPVTAGEWA